MTTQAPFREFILKKTPSVLDGGMATSLYDKGFYINRSFEELNLTAPETVYTVLSEFLRAGAQILTTNSFGATVPKLSGHNIQDRHEEILRKSVSIAKKVAGDQAFVVGSMGPLGLVLEPLGPTSREEARQFFATKARILCDEGVDGFILEGFHDFNELTEAILAIQSVSKKPIISAPSIQENRKTSFGHTLDEYIQLVHKLNVDVVGLAGEVGPSGMLTALEYIRPLTEKPIAVLPNAGLPRFVNDQYIYLCNPDYMGKFAKRFVLAGANIIGGHSGVGEQHIRAISTAIRMAGHAVNKTPSVSIALSQPIQPPKKAQELEKRSSLGQYLATGKKVISIEINPPRGVDFEKFKSYCQQIEDAEIPFVNIPDGARAVARMSSLQLATYVSGQFNVEPIPHLTARDRNLLGLQSDLLGAYVNGVRNVLLVTGDPPKLGNCPGASGVYDVDAIGLTHLVRRMNEGLDVGGSSFGNGTEYVVGVALNPTAQNQKLERERFLYKVEAGADYAITQPIYDVSQYEQFVEGLGGKRIPIIMGIWPLISLRNAEFLKFEVPGVSVPDWVIAEMEKAGDNKDEAIKRGLDIAMKTMDQAKDFVAGFQISAPFNRVDIAVNAIRSVFK